MMFFRGLVASILAVATLGHPVVRGYWMWVPSPKLDLSPLTSISAQDAAPREKSTTPILKDTTTTAASTTKVFTSTTTTPEALTVTETSSAPSLPESTTSSTSSQTPDPQKGFWAWVSLLREPAEIASIPGNSASATVGSHIAKHGYWAWISYESTTEEPGEESTTSSAKSDEDTAEVDDPKKSLLTEISSPTEKVEEVPLSTTTDAHSSTEDPCSCCKRLTRSASTIGTHPTSVAESSSLSNGAADSALPQELSPDSSSTVSSLPGSSPSTLSSSEPPETEGSGASSVPAQPSAPPLSSFELQSDLTLSQPSPADLPSPLSSQEFSSPELVLHQISSQRDSASISLSTQVPNAPVAYPPDSHNLIAAQPFSSPPTEAWPPEPSPAVMLMILDEI